MTNFGLRAAVLAGAVVTVAGPAAAGTVYDNAVLAQAPLAYFTFDAASGTTTTSVANGYTEVLQNGATTAPGFGPVINGTADGALILRNGSGGTQFATAGGTTPLNGGIANAGTIIAWINLASLPSTQGRIFSIAGQSQGGNDFDFQIEGDQLRFYTDGGSFTGANRTFTASDLGGWIFVAGSFSGGVSRNVYINGVNVGSSTPGNHGANTAPFYLGQSNVFGGRYFDGAMSNVAVFNTALTDAQIAGIFASAALPDVPAVPEPASWALLIGGFGMTGGALRRAGRTQVRVRYA